MPNQPETGKEIVLPREGYDYEAMCSDLKILNQKYSFIKLSTIGKSVAGRPIPALQIGQGLREIHYNGAFHANEWITSLLLMKFVDTYAQAFHNNLPLGKFDIQRIFETTSLWIVPMVNPDGVQLVQIGIPPTDPYYNEVLKINNGSANFKGWKANLHGVDLNDQFPAAWESEAARRGIKRPAPHDYPGVSPLSEPEAEAMAEFTRTHYFRLVCAFHTQGEEIYWGYRKLEPAESREIVQTFTAVSGYRAVRYVDSDAGYKDWFIQEWRKPGFTIECGRGKSPLPITGFEGIWNRTIGILLTGLALQDQATNFSPVIR